MPGACTVYRPKAADNASCTCNRGARFKAGHCKQGQGVAPDCLICHSLMPQIKPINDIANLKGPKKCTYCTSGSNAWGPGQFHTKISPDIGLYLAVSRHISIYSYVYIYESQAPSGNFKWIFHATLWTNKLWRWWVITFIYIYIYAWDFRILLKPYIQAGLNQRRWSDRCRSSQLNWARAPANRIPTLKNWRVWEKKLINSI